MSKLNDWAGEGFLPAPVPMTTIDLILASTPGRGADLQVRVSVPKSGGKLPVIVFSHGNGSSKDG